MLNFVKCGDHHYEIGEHNVVHGFLHGLTAQEVQEQILDLFPKQFDGLVDEIHFNLMLVKDDASVVRYIPFAEICFVPEVAKKLIHVRIKKRCALTGVVIFKDVDTFYGTDANIENIKVELANHLVSHYHHIERQG